MAGGCKSAIGCVDARVPVRASYVSLYKWPESDAEFVRSVAMARRHHHHLPDQSPAAAAMADGVGRSPRVVDSYSCRQMYLRSYTFSTRKETVPERTMACLARVRTRVFPSRGGSDAGSSSSVGGSARGFAAAANAAGRDEEEEDDEGSGTRRKRRRRRRKKKKKGPCAVVRRLQEASLAVFRRLLACTATVDVAEPPSR